VKQHSAGEVVILWCVHGEFSYKSIGEIILKIGPHLPKLLSNISILTRNIDIAILSVRPSVRDVPVSDENGLTLDCHSSFTIR